MDNKTLVETILKKIIEIEEIVARFTESDPIHQIEIDNSLSKVRCLYDELLILDRINGKIAKKEESSEDKVEASTPEDKSDTLQEKVQPIEIEAQQDNESKTHAIKEDTTLIEDESTEHEIGIEFIDVPIVEDNIDAPEIEDKPIVHDDRPAEKKEKESQPTLFDSSTNKKTDSSNKKIVADNFSETSESVNDLIAKFKKETDLATQLQYKPIADIKSAISLNDKIMYIKELFNDDADECNKAIDHINSLSNLDEAMTYINENYDWSDESDSFKKFLELVYRRFLDANK